MHSQTLKSLKESIVDFLYRFKDKHPSSNLMIMSLDVAYRVMDFMQDNNLKPSDALIEEYRQSNTTRILNLFPTYIQLRSTIDMYDWRYVNLRKAYSSRPEFIYYFDPDLDIQTKVGWNMYGFPSEIRIGYFKKWMVKQINNLTLHLNFLLIITFFLICS